MSPRGPAPQPDGTDVTTPNRDSLQQAAGDRGLCLGHVVVRAVRPSVGSRHCSQLYHISYTVTLQSPLAISLVLNTPTLPFCAQFRQVQRRAPRERHTVRIGDRSPVAFLCRTRLLLFLGKMRPQLFAKDKSAGKEVLTLCPASLALRLTGASQGMNAGGCAPAGHTRPPRSSARRNGSRPSAVCC